MGFSGQAQAGVLARAVFGSGAEGDSRRRFSRGSVPRPSTSWSEERIKLLQKSPHQELTRPYPLPHTTPAGSGGVEGSEASPLRGTAQSRPSAPGPTAFAPETPAHAGLRGPGAEASREEEEEEGGVSGGLPLSAGGAAEAKGPRRPSRWR